MEFVCSHCSNALSAKDRFCASCGAKIQLTTHEKESDSVRLVIYFYISYLVYAVVAHFIYLDNDSPEIDIAMEGVFILMTLVFCFFDRKNIFALYNIKHIQWKNLLFSILFPIATAIVVFYGINWFNRVILEEEDINIFYSYILYENPFVWAFIFTVIVAPVFEELAFRGFLFNQVRVIANPAVTIFATAFIFALVHFSLISILWIFPFGIVLGYLRHKFNTLWLGMIVHFIHNLIVLLMDYQMYNIELVFDF